MSNDTFVLFGAGASYGATHVQPRQPPLTDKLYAELGESSPKQWGPGTVFAAHSEAFRHNFEETFAKIVLGESNFDGPRIWPSLNILEAQCPIAMYFSQFTLEPGGLDCYSKLLVSLRSAGRLFDCLFSSLNYDCLLEQAAVHIGIEVDYSCTQNQALRVVKLHGSSNLITERISDQTRALLAAQGTRVELHSFFVYPTTTNLQELKWKLGGPEPAHFAVMSQISPQKEHFVAPVFMQQIWNQWTAAVLDARTIAIVGVKYNANDRHVVDPIRHSRAKVLYIGDGESALSWNAEHLACTFEDGLGSLIERLTV
jgi:hypothetical protein